MKINHNTKKINYNLSSISSTHGFSLVELMVVVAIIGILASVAVPQFARFQAKAKQTEAKTLLATLYTSEAAFYVEYSGYGSGLNAIGFAPSLNGAMKYVVGFTDSATSCATNYGDCSAEKHETYSYCGTTKGGTCWIEAGTNGTTANTLTSTSCSDCTLEANFQTFKAGATAYIGKSGSTIDTWTINESKYLDNPTKGID